MFYDLKDKKPKSSGENWVAPNATIIGDVTLEKNTSVWFNAVLRGDIENIFVGEGVKCSRRKRSSYRSRMPTKNWKKCNYRSYGNATWLYHWR
jgi:carbonic anhydrase/acetyltransferase-like protein (isoleucine patch superfamily)